VRTGHGRKTLGGRDSTAIFITWDDWGGFYDHVQPPKIDENAYLKLIEDRFLGDLVTEFDFNQPPRPPLLLDPTP